MRIGCYIKLLQGMLLLHMLSISSTLALTSWHQSLGNIFEHFWMISDTAGTTMRLVPRSCGQFVKEIPHITLRVWHLGEVNNSMFSAHVST
jgi:hypothetical protein